LGLDSKSVFQVFYPNLQYPGNSGRLIVRTAGDPAGVVPALRTMIHESDKEIPLQGIITMDDRLAKAFTGPKFYAVLMGSFSAIAILLSLVGLYGVISHSVSLRTQEIGIRAALGAQSADILKLVVGQGLWMTLIISAVTLVLAMLGGLVIAMLDMSRWRVVRIVGITFGEIIRNTPILVQLLWVYYVLPIVFDIGIGSLAALIIGLSVYQSAFISEVYRSGIQAVPQGHREAAQVLGLTQLQTLRRIVLPQAIRMTLPPLASNFVQLIKFSSLGAVISVSEITRRGMELSSSAFRPLEIFTFIAFVYFLICWPLAMAIRFWERRVAAR